MSDDRRGSGDSDMKGDGGVADGSRTGGEESVTGGSTGRTAWHVPEEDLRAYVQGALEPPRLWSTDTHLAACDRCRAELAACSDPVALDAGWERLDAELDAPRPGPVEALLVRFGVADHTARLLAAAPVLRRSWLGAVVAVLAMTVAAANAARVGATPTLFLALAPLLPLAGVAVSYGPKLDPAYEMAVVSPLHGFRLLMIRTVAVLTVGLGLNGVATLALPSYGLRALAWLLPALALTASGLALASRLGPVLAPSLVAGGWVTVLAVAQATTASGTTLAPFTAAGQGVAGAVAVLAAALLYLARDRFDTSRLPFTDLTDRNAA
ncbi:anti-sigma factor family protein [Streptomyces sp. NPDC060011]|uniref:anti-sigma factor family protein n=1 Tax=unclassified Streptomyces TaxID=2593676 RepID=UPI00224F0D81|nr:zf-HC2 domain-containing protein [Streptomyces sp. NBC_00687]MCX4915604.1 zf-HC2 domain-containing protein [Streptomyces sp. NBC_00687]